MAFKSVAAGKDKAAPRAKPARAVPARATAASVEEHDQATGEDEGQAGDGGVAQFQGKKAKEPKEEYELLQAGTIVDSVMYPNPDAKKGEEMIVKMTHTEAQNHQMGGVPLRRRE